MILFITLILLILILLMLYKVRNQEREELSNAVRKTVWGSFVKLQEGFVHYEIAGPADGRVIALVHGFSTWSFTWEATFHALVHAGFRVLRYDLYGRGYSDRPDVDYDEDLFDRQLSELLNVLGIDDRIDLIGNSMGGLIATTFAARHPEKVRTVTLIDPAFFFLGRVPFPLGVPFLGEYVCHVFAIPFIARVQTRDFKHAERFPDYDALYRIQMRYKGFARAILSTIRSLPHWDTFSDLSRVNSANVPVLLLWGRDDKTIPISVSDKVRKNVPHADFLLIDDAAHMPHYERPDVVSPIILEFLNAHEA
jgi:pimeloyl-ACP methyl ester carboxylesterase